MAKEFHFESIGQIKMQKRRNNRYIRLSVSHDGTVRLTMPVWTPYKFGEAFVRGKKRWLLKQLKNTKKAEFRDGDRIGRVHQLKIIKSANEHLDVRLLKTKIIVSLPKVLSTSDQKVQTGIKKAAHRALKKEANQLLPLRVNQLSKSSGFKYNSLKVRHLKTRWGSCSSNKDLVLSYYLMQLPWELIDYVILHELVHTKIMSHGKVFWDELEKHVPNLKQKKLELKQYKSTLLPKSLESAEA